MGKISGGYRFHPDELYLRQHVPRSVSDRKGKLRILGRRRTV